MVGDICRKSNSRIVWLICNLSALFYGGYGVIMIPSLGIVDAYGGYTPEYHNALGFFVLCKFCSMIPYTILLTDLF